MKSIPAPVIEAMEEGGVIIAAAIRIETDDPDEPMAVWSGLWPLTLFDEEYVPLQAPGLAGSFQFEVGQSALGIEIIASGIEPALVPTVLQQDLRGRDVVVYRLYFDRAGTTMMHAEPFFRGTCNEVPVRDTTGPGGSGISEAVFRLEGEAYGSQRRGGRLSADQDQRLVDPDDGSFRYISSMAEKVLYWGAGRGERAGGALNGGASGTTPPGGYMP